MLIAILFESRLSRAAIVEWWREVDETAIMDVGRPVAYGSTMRMVKCNAFAEKWLREYGTAVMVEQ